MAYDISSLDMRSLENKRYFFDANLWLIFLKNNLNPNHRDLKYLKFFESFKAHVSRPIIVVTALVLSEVINRYLRDVAMDHYLKKQNINSPSKSYYKETFRKTPDFKLAYDLLCNDIMQYQHIFELVADELGTGVSSSHILSSPPSGLDFNDHYYCLLAKKNKYIIVTDDADFFVQDVEILTYNNYLLQKAKNSIVIKK